MTSDRNNFWILGKEGIQIMPSTIHKVSLFFWWLRETSASIKKTTAHEASFLPPATGTQLCQLQKLFALWAEAAHRQHNSGEWFVSLLGHKADFSGSLVPNGPLSPSAKMAAHIWAGILVTYWHLHVRRLSCIVSQKGLVTYSLLAIHSGSQVAWWLTELMRVCF